MSVAPWVTCVMIFLDGARFIDEAIRSVVEQRGMDDWELVLVDDGSTDASTSIARHWAATDERIQYLDHPEHANLGMSASRNAGLAAARGHFVGFLDCDDVWLPSRLAHARRVADAHPDADVVIGASWRWHGWTGAPEDVARDDRHVLPPVPLGVTIEPPTLFAAMYADPPWWNELAMCGLLVRRAALLGLGGMDPAYRGLFEDQVLYVKLALGASVVLDPRPVALYRQHEGSACAQAVTAGEWSPLGDSPALRRFLAWMIDYVTATCGPSAPATAIAAANQDFAWGSVTEWPATAAARRWHRAVPAPVRRLARRVRVRQHRPTLVGHWSEQFLRPALAGETGRTLVVRRGVRRDPWSATIPARSMGVAEVIHARWWSRRARGTFDTVVVPLAAGRSGAAPTARRVAARLRPAGTALIVAPATAAIAVSLRRAVPDAVVTVEPCGNGATASALVRPMRIDEVDGVTADRADPAHPVLHTVTVRRPSPGAPA